MAMTYTCPVCGFDGLEDPPRSPDSGGSYEICSSCGFEFGVTDDDRGYTYEAWRARWIARGMPWETPNAGPPPNGWDAHAQLRNVTGAETEAT